MWHWAWRWAESVAGQSCDKKKDCDVCGWCNSQRFELMSVNNCCSSSINRWFTLFIFCARITYCSLYWCHRWIFFAVIPRQIPHNYQSDDPTCKILSAHIDQDEVRLHVKKSWAEIIHWIFHSLGYFSDWTWTAIKVILSMPQMEMIVFGFKIGILAWFD